ncbi:MAG TPA: glycosyltransferase [Acidimicrobiales bacterium]|nr:glycosyltransferase [Acidimicrobiales bacterium]
MRVTLVHPFAWPEVRRGAERYVDDLARYLGGAGHTVTVVTGTHGSSRTERLGVGITARYRRHVLAGRGGRAGVGAVETFGVPALAELLGRRADVVHAFTPSGALAGRLAGRPTLYSVLGHPDASQLPERAVARLLFDAALCHATRVATLSRASAAALAATAGRRAAVLAPGVRVERFPLEAAPRTGPVRLLFSASLDDRRKRADLAVAALAVVLRRHPDARLALSGTGDPSWALAGADADVRAAVDLPGPGRPDEVAGRYRHATVTVLPAEHEAFGLALVESLACGTPVVCLASGGAPEIVEGSEGGPVGAVAAEPAAGALADAVARAVALARQPGAPRRCAAHARRFSWEVVGPAHERVYETVGHRPASAHAPVTAGSSGAPHGRGGVPGARRQPPRPSDTGGDRRGSPVPVPRDEEDEEEAS